MQRHVQQSQSQQPPQPPLVIYPGVGIGPFRLGCSIGSVLAQLQGQPALLRGQPASLTSSSAEPSAVDLTLELPALGLRLRFDARTQRLHLIDAFDSTRGPLVYMKTPLCVSGAQGSTPALPTLSQLYRLFGPTFLGTFSPADRVYMLQYPGVAMAFHLPDADATFDPHAGDAADQQQQLVLRDGRSPPLHRLFVHGGSDVAEYARALPPAPLACDSYFEPLVVLLGRGVLLERRGVLVGFDCRAQDLLSDIGPPQNIHIKRHDTDKMSIHRQLALAQQAAAAAAAHSQTHSPLVTPRTLAGGVGSAAAAHAAALGLGLGPDGRAPSPPPHTPDYWYNYFLLGFDVLLDGVSHRVKKIVLHTNFVERPDFGTYARANFVIQAKHSGQATQHAQQRSSLSLLELPPTAVQQQYSGSMLHGGMSASNTSTGGEGGSLSVSPLPIAALSSEPQSISINMGAAGGNEGAAVAATSNGKKKKKKASDAKEADAAAASAASAAASISSPGQAAPKPPPSPTPPALMSFSPSLSPSVLPVSHATAITPESKVRAKQQACLVAPTRALHPPVHAAPVCVFFTGSH